MWTRRFFLFNSMWHWLHLILIGLDRGRCATGGSGGMWVDVTVGDGDISVDTESGDARTERGGCGWLVSVCKSWGKGAVKVDMGGGDWNIRANTGAEGKWIDMGYESGGICVTDWEFVSVNRGVGSVLAIEGRGHVCVETVERWAVGDGLWMSGESASWSVLPNFSLHFWRWVTNCTFLMTVAGQ